MGQSWVTAYIIQWAVIAILLIMFYQTLKLLGQYIRKVDRIERRAKGGLTVEKLFPKYKAKSITTPDMIDTTSEKGHNLFIFVSPTCHACEDVLLNLHQFNSRQQTDVTVISMKDEDNSHVKYFHILKERGIPMILDNALFGDLSIPSMPYGILIDEQRKIINYGEAGSMKEVNELVDSPMIQETA
jgi:hypothetical protein